MGESPLKEVLSLPRLRREEDAHVLASLPSVRRLEGEVMAELVLLEPPEGRLGPNEPKYRC